VRRRAILAGLVAGALALAAGGVADARRGVTVRNGPIAFSSERDGDNEIFSMRANGSHQTQLTQDRGNDYAPAYSPDGAKIAFTYVRTANSAGQLYSINADGSGLALIEPTHGRLSFHDDPTYSPDGARIAYDGNFEPHRDIFSMSSAGRDPRGQQLTTDPADDSAPAYSPDGTKIAFLSTRDGDPDIYVMNTDGAGVQQITHDNLREYAPAYSPDGQWVAYARTAGGNTEIFRMRLSDGHVQRLTHDNVGDFGPVYSPGGRFIAFEASHRGGLDIFTMRANGTHVVRLTNARGDDAYPTWAPQAVR
jgi:Tol biopolymer transport system component